MSGVMKKLITCLGICCLTLFAGVFLVSCKEPDTYRISLGQVDENIIVQLENMPDEEILPADASNGWTVGKDAQIRVKIIATKQGVVMDNAVIKINGTEKEVDDRNYNMFDNEKLTYCWFNLPMVQLKSNIQISVTGTEMKKSTFTFNIDENFAQDEELVEKLQNTYICTDDSDNYTSFYQFLQGSKKSYTKDFDSADTNANTYRSFKMQFKVQDTVINDLYDFSATNIFQISTQSFSAPARSIFVDGDHLVVNLGDLGGEDEYTINVNFNELELAQFTFDYPTEQDEYDITIDQESVSYGTGATLIFTKKDKENYDYSNLVIKIGDVELEIKTGSLDADEITYTIPENLTPMLAGLGMNANGVYTITVEGIEPIEAE